MLGTRLFKRQGSTHQLSTSLDNALKNLNFSKIWPNTKRYLEDFEFFLAGFTVGGDYN